MLQPFPHAYLQPRIPVPLFIPLAPVDRTAKLLIAGLQVDIHGFNDCYQKN